MKAALRVLLLRWPENARSRALTTRLLPVDAHNS